VIFLNEGGHPVVSAGDYHSGFLFMLTFAALSVVGASRIRETNCRNITVEN